MLETKFIEILKSCRGKLDPVIAHKKMLSRHGSKIMAGHSICVSCFSNRPSCVLSCCHRVCEGCIRCLGQYVRGIEFQLRKCLLCKQEQHEPFNVKPPTAGVRTLEISGGVDAAPVIARSLKSLCANLPGPLCDYFDLVIGRDVGLFFTIMIFCKEASVDDCIHHLKNLEHFKERKGRLLFGPRLKFAIEDLQSNKVKILRYVGTSTYECRYLPACRSRQEQHRIWPNCRTDFTHDYNGVALTDETVRAHGRTLLASLFYLELVDFSHEGGLLAVRLEVKCRLPSGQHMLDVINRVGQARLIIYGEEHEFFTKHQWDDLAASKTLAKAFLVNVPDDTTPIDAKFKGGVVDGASLSNCPLSLHDLDARAWTRKRQKR